MTTASDPSGSTPPVGMPAASPGLMEMSGRIPIGISPVLFKNVGVPGVAATTSELCTAKPSLRLLVCGGYCSSASMSPDILFPRAESIGISTVLICQGKESPSATCCRACIRGVTSLTKPDIKTATFRIFIFLTKATLSQQEKRDIHLSPVSLIKLSPLLFQSPGFLHALCKKGLRLSYLQSGRPYIP